LVKWGKGNSFITEEEAKQLKTHKGIQKMAFGIGMFFLKIFLVGFIVISVLLVSKVVRKKIENSKYKNIIVTLSVFLLIMLSIVGLFKFLAPYWDFKKNIVYKVVELGREKRYEEAEKYFLNKEEKPMAPFVFEQLHNIGWKGGRFAHNVDVSFLIKHGEPRTKVEYLVYSERFPASEYKVIVTFGSNGEDLTKIANMSVGVSTPQRYFKKNGPKIVEWHKEYKEAFKEFKKA
jgi:glutaredoxin